mmetsp:Transcript_8941/g.16081  ORF Transcript_8941/g.16081 Transcript_8941/m.16081 type:complete len:153 (-) Transcript_8941:985-1443(-)
MASELSNFIDAELARAAQHSPDKERPSDTESLLKDKRREALRVELEQGHSRRLPFSIRLCLVALACFGVLLVMGAYITARSAGGASVVGEESDVINNPSAMFGAGDDYYGADYGDGDYEGYSMDDYFDEDYTESGGNNDELLKALYEEDYEP